MIQNPPKEHPALSWFIAWLWTAIVFLTIPKARAFQKAITEQWGRDTYIYFVLTLLAIGSLLILTHLLRNRQRFSWYHILCLLIIATIYAKQTWALKAKSPAEALHFVMYGLMFLLFFRAMLHRTRDYLIFPAALSLTSLCGNLDETIQWLTPQRIFDWRDVGLNAFSGTMILLLLLGPLRPTYLNTKPTTASLWRLILLLALHATISFLCLINTPTRTAQLIKHIPALQQWSHNWGEMTEYGHLYTDPKIGQFKSRLSPNQLRTYDQTHGHATAQLFNAQLSLKYSQFLRDIAPATKPYLHEIRVHLHRRGRYLKARIQHRNNNPEKYAEYTSVAVKEHRILTTYYPTFMKTFHDNVTPQWLHIMETEMQQNHPYTSRVSATLITHFSQKTIYILYPLTLITLLLIGTAYTCANKTKPLLKAENG